MAKFMKRHPFWGGLVKRVITIVVSWNVVLACIFGTILSFGLVIAIFAGIGAASGLGSYTPVYGTGVNQLLSIKISGTILGSSEPDQGFSGLFTEGGNTYGYDVKDQLYAAAEDPNVVGVILEIDSPGGTIYGATAIADGVWYYKQKTNKPVYAHIEGLGASAAYWAAASADRIYADNGSSVGSIGVILGPIEYYDTVLATDGGLLGGGVITQNGIDSTYFTAGKSKDVGNPYRRLTQAEVGQLQQSVDAEYDRFVSYVSKQRDISENTIRDSIGAMIYEPGKAQELKLTDAVGSRQVAYANLGEAARIGNDYTVVRQLAAPGLAEAVLGAVTGRNQEPKAVDLCALTRTTLAYHGDVSAWCSKQ